MCFLDRQSDLAGFEVRERDIRHVEADGTVLEHGDLMLPPQDALLQGFNELVPGYQDIQAFHVARRPLVEGFAGGLELRFQVDVHRCGPDVAERIGLRNVFRVCSAFSAPVAERVVVAGPAYPVTDLQVHDRPATFPVGGIGLAHSDGGVDLLPCIRILPDREQAVDLGSQFTFLRLLRTCHPGSDTCHGPCTDLVPCRIADRLQRLGAFKGPLLYQSPIGPADPQAVHQRFGVPLIDYDTSVPDHMECAQVLQHAFGHWFVLHRQVPAVVSSSGHHVVPEGHYAVKWPIRPE